MHIETTTRRFEFDSAHRVMNQNSKCKNLHGHRYVLEATFSYEEKEDIGYAIDFSDIKRVLGGFIDKYLDHGTIVNPQDEYLVQYARKTGTKVWFMGTGPREIDLLRYINPTAENIVKELVLVAYYLFSKHPLIKPYSFKLMETPNCWVEYVLKDMGVTNVPEFEILAEEFLTEIGGFLEYDDRKNP